MSEPIKSQIISRRRIFLLAAIAAFAVPATMLPMSNAGAQQAGDQAPADQTPPKPAEKKKKKKKKKLHRGHQPLQRAVRRHHQNSSSTRVVARRPPPGRISFSRAWGSGGGPQSHLCRCGYRLRCLCMSVDAASSENRPAAVHRRIVMRFIVSLAGVLTAIGVGPLRSSQLRER